MILNPKDLPKLTLAEVFDDAGFEVPGKLAFLPNKDLKKPEQVPNPYFTWYAFRSDSFGPAKVYVFVDYHDHPSVPIEEAGWVELPDSLESVRQTMPYLTSFPFDAGRLTIDVCVYALPRMILQTIEDEFGTDQ